MRSASVLFPSALAFLVCFQSRGQEVLSARSGVVHFIEGSVFVDDHALDRKFGEFPNIKEGSTLRTEKGRAEVLLTPGVFLRLDEKSSVRMVSTSLVDTKLEFLSGTAIVDSVDAPVNNSVVVTYKDAQVRFPKQGIYRFDSVTEVLQTYSGEAEVKHDGKTSHVDSAHLYFFFPGVETEKIGEGAFDEFYDWAKDRSEIITAQNQTAAQSEANADSDEAQLPPLGSYPNLGSPNLGSPNTGPLGGTIGNVPLGGTIGTVPGLSMGAGSVLFDPYLPLRAGTYFPYGNFPVFVVVRPFANRLTRWQQHQHNVNARWPDPPRWLHGGNPQWRHDAGSGNWPRPAGLQWQHPGASQWQHPANSQWQHSGPYPHIGVPPAGMSHSFINHTPMSHAPAPLSRPMPAGPRVAPMGPHPMISHPMAGSPRPSGR